MAGFDPEILTCTCMRFALSSLPLTSRRPRLATQSCKGVGDVRGGVRKVSTLNLRVCDQLTRLIHSAVNLASIAETADDVARATVTIAVVITPAAVFLHADRTAVVVI